MERKRAFFFVSNWNEKLINLSQLLDVEVCKWDSQSWTVADISSDNNKTFFCPNWFIAQEFVSILTFSHKHRDKLYSTVCLCVFLQVWFIIMKYDSRISYQLSFVWHILFQCLGFAASCCHSVLEVISVSSLSYKCMTSEENDFKSPRPVLGQSFVTV